MAAAMSVMFQGLTSIAPAPSDCAAPANSLSTNTPARTVHHHHCSLSALQSLPPQHVDKCKRHKATGDKNP
jgi:hypothetical protein